MMRLAAVLFALVLAASIPVARGAEDPADAIAKARDLAARGSYEAAKAALHDALAEHPGDAELLLELGRTAYAQAKEILGSTSPTLGRLALLDAVRWLRQAAAAKPEWPEALRLLGRVGVEAGEFATAAEAWRAAAELDPSDGESRYQLGYCLAFLGRYQEALAAFEAAERILGPDPRILLNRGITQLRLSLRGEAERSFLTLVRGEIAADRRGSTEMQGGFKWLWRMHSDRRDWEAAVAVFTKLAAEFPDLATGWFYLAHSCLEENRPAEAAAAFEKVAELKPDWADGFRQLGEAWVAAGEPAKAVPALKRLAELDPAGEAAPIFLLAVARAFVGKGEGERALALLDEYEPVFPGDPIILERRADVLFRLGRYADAIRDYRTSVAGDPFADAVRVKEQKAATALLRGGDVPAELRPLRPPAGGAAKPRKPTPILDFERSEAFPRVNGAATGVRSGGGFRLTRTGEPGTMANLSLTFIPTMDSRPFVSLRFVVEGPKGGALLLRAKDGYDQFEMADGFLRLLYREPVELTGERQTVTVPIDGFLTHLPNRPIPMNRARLRALVFEIGSPRIEGAALAKEIWLDDVAFVREDGSAEVVADFDGPPEETLFLTTGSASAFARTLSRPEDVAGFRPDANTWINPAIFKEAFDPATVHGGEGAFRMTLVREGEAAGELSFNPDRDFDDATAITFFARGAAGGERLRVTLEDALDQELRNPAPASAPRLETPGRISPGWFTLTTEWKEYVIPRAAFPDVDFRSLLTIAFHFGTPDGNAPGTIIYLDDVKEQ